MSSNTSTLPAKNKEYGTKEYWDSRYTQEETTTFDWFKSYSDIAHLIRPLISDKNARILMLGCGNSSVSEEMWDDGYRNIVNVDYSPVVIEQMKARHKETRPSMEWHVMDIRDLRFPEASFDVVIDKGTMDGMMTDCDSVWDPPEHVVSSCNAEIDEVLRVLRSPGGTFLYLTFGQPHFRKRYLQREGTELEITTLGEAFHYYMYILRKK